MTDKELVTGNKISRSFLTLLGCPENTRKLSFSIEAGGLLKCHAESYNGFGDELVSTNWIVQLDPESIFYKLLTEEA